MTDKTLRRYHIFFSLPIAEAYNHDKLLTDALNCVDKSISPAGAYAEIFLNGILATIEKAEQFSEDYEIHIALKQERKERARKAILTELYESLGLEKFRSWAEKAGIDVESFRSEYAIFEKSEIIPWVERAKRWLYSELSDGLPHNTSDIKQAALEAGVIRDDKDWGNLRTLASREKISRGEKGIWKIHY